MRRIHAGRVVQLCGHASGAFGSDVERCGMRYGAAWSGPSGRLRRARKTTAVSIVVGHADVGARPWAIRSRIASGCRRTSVGSRALRFRGGAVMGEARYSAVSAQMATSWPVTVTLSMNDETLLKPPAHVSLITPLKGFSLR